MQPTNMPTFRFTPDPKGYRPSFYDPSALDRFTHEQAYGNALLTDPETGQAHLYSRNDLVAIEGVEYGNYYQITSADEDGSGNERSCLILVDMQGDFIYPDGALGVAGAVDDTRRLVEWAYRNLGSISKILASLDTHLPYQIFHPLYWRTLRQGTWQMPHPLTPITSDQYMQVFHPLIWLDFDTEDIWNEDYMKHLEGTDKKSLMAWTTHCLEGSVGRSLHPAVSDLILFHSAARRVNPVTRPKGTNVATEHYGIFGAEREVPNDSDTQIDANSLDTISTYDNIYIAGQAKSHCVLETVRQMIEWGDQNAKSMLPKMHLLMDCMSSVAHPDIDFEAIAQPIYEGWAKNYGLKLIDTTHDIPA